MTIALLRKLIKNNIDINEGDIFTAIIGLNPSQGARSPLLWNAVFKKHAPSLKMHAFDVEKEKLNDLLSLLDSNPNFVGGAIAAPYKEKVYDFLKNNVDQEVNLIKSVNSLSKRDNKLHGHNTDGKASLFSFKKNFGNILKKKILILGYGGVGKSVAAYFSKELGNYDKINIITSQDIKSNNFNFFKKDSLLDLLPEIDILINCTSVGWSNKENESPIDISSMKLLRKKTLVFDVIYQPKKTKFLKYCEDLGLSYINGQEMNLYQAIFALLNVNTNLKMNLNEELIKSSMVSV